MVAPRGEAVARGVNALPTKSTFNGRRSRTNFGCCRVAIHVVCVLATGSTKKDGRSWSWARARRQKPAQAASRRRSGRVELIVQLLRAVPAAPRVIHRDIKPSNVLMRNGRVKLVDFGISLNTIGKSRFDDSFAGRMPISRRGSFSGRRRLRRTSTASGWWRTKCSLGVIRMHRPRA
jgi:serine/threonine protein kinase